MKNLANIAWWLCFLYFAICIQAIAPGLDVLVVGLIILMQDEDYKSILWLAPIFCLLQEGMGTRPFGSTIIWYGAVIGIFILGRWLFEARNFVFVFLLSASLGGTYFLVAWVTSPLQNIPFSFSDTVDKSLTQAIFMPFAWRIMLAFKPGSKRQIETDSEV